MQQNAKFIRKLPIPMDIKKEFPVTEEVAKVREAVSYTHLDVYKRQIKRRAFERFLDSSYSI